MKYALVAAAFLTSGCADLYLDREERRALTDESARFGPTILGQGTLGATNDGLAVAASTANRLSAAYYRAAKSSSKAQDVASGIVVLSAASVVTGAASSASNTSLADRALIGAGAERVASRGVPKASIKTILKGAKTMNCIGTIATIYTAIDSPVRTSPLATELTLAAIREVRVSVRDDIARDVEDFSALVTVFQEALPDPSGATPAANTFRTTKAERGNASQKDLETYLVRLSGCLKKPDISDNTKKKS